MEMKPRNSKRVRQTRHEDQLSAACVDYLTILEKQGHLRWFGVPNWSGKLHPRIQAQLKKQGRRAGVPDLQILFPIRHHPTIKGPADRPKVLFVELKRPKTATVTAGRMSDAQKEWGAWLTAAGFAHYVVSSVDELKGIIQQHRRLTNGPLPEARTPLQIVQGFTSGTPGVGYHLGETEIPDA